MKNEGDILGGRMILRAGAGGACRKEEIRVLFSDPSHRLGKSMFCDRKQEWVPVWKMKK